MKLPKFTGLATLALLFLSLATTSAFADTLTLDYAPTHPSGFPGGAFRTSNVVGGPLAGTSFDTFCLETGEFFSPGGTYSYAVSSAAVHGGTTNGSDPISIGTAYLYNNYLQNGGDQKAIQQAIWWLEDETTTGEEQCSTACHSLLADAAVALFGLGANETQLKADCAAQCNGVVALNLTDSNGNLAQDQVGRVPEAGATLLLSMGLVSLVWFARRKNLLPQSSAQVGSLA